MKTDILIGILIAVACMSMATAVFLVLESQGYTNFINTVQVQYATAIQYDFTGSEEMPVSEEPLPIPAETPTTAYPIDDATYNEETPSETCPYTITITLSAAGDTTLGGDSRWAGYRMFMQEFRDSGNDHSHFLRNIAHIFRDSDLAIVNLEGPLTYAEYHMDKEFVFRGPPHFAQILSSSYIDAVTVANNHTRDFFEQGYRDTINALRAEDIAYFGNEFNTLMEINGITVGLFGHSIWNNALFNQNRVTASIEYLRENGAQLIIAYFHWGVESENVPEPYQVYMGRFAIREGADLVLGAHPHVIQGVEVYRGRHIVYSLANFCFGGNANPADQDSFIFQQTFKFYHGELQPYDHTEIIPIFISSVRYRNDFRPTIAEGDDALRILSRIEQYSNEIPDM